VQNFQRLGVPLGLQVGKGKRIDYSRSEIYQLVFCLELSELGFDPSHVANLIQDRWAAYLHLIDRAMDGKKTKLFYATKFMSHSWATPAKDPDEDSYGFSREVIQLVSGEHEDLPKGHRHLAMLDVTLIVQDIEKLLAGILPPASGAA
jgi:hypothetical protein